MVKLYVSLILKGAKKIEDVPISIRKEVEELLKQARELEDNK